MTQLALDLETLAGPPATTNVMGVPYVHLRLAGGDDLYLTQHGLPFARQLLPEHYWTDRAWRNAHMHKLSGTSTVYRIDTRPVDERGLTIVLKWNRMGQDIPGETQADDLTGASFNSPFEEFALLAELRNAAADQPIYTHKPLAIYVPAEHVEPDLLGRRASMIREKIASHDEITLHPTRQYAVIYEWIKGMDAAEAFTAGLIDRDQMVALTHRLRDDLAERGFAVRDNKPQHVIVRANGDSGLLRDREGTLHYATVDFELLERTAERESEVRQAKRRSYLWRQAHRFECRQPFPSHLSAENVFGVDYVYGHIESTGGALWVVGRDPELFDYFLPEKWRRTDRTKLSTANQIYATVTKDNIHLVWKVSRVGELPDMDPFRGDEKRILEHGYNSPFEEVALNLQLERAGIATTYPRAIYMTGGGRDLSPSLRDPRRYESHADLRDPRGLPALRPDHEYIILWGWWNGPDEMLAERDEDYFRGINALTAWREGTIDEQTYLRLMRRTRRTLSAVGVEDLNLRGNHLLLSIDKDGKLLREDDGSPNVRVCTFDLLRRIENA